jgi:uncharacterized protein
MARFFFALFFLFSSFASSQIINPSFVDSIPMQDNKKLPADVYLPIGWTSGPVILIQTPYNRQFYRFTGLPLGISSNINASNYAIVIVDWRGFWGGSQAQYSGAPDHGEDGYSTVEWISAQSWSDGNIGTWGPSALGNVQYQTAKKQPPHLKCICPLVAGPQTLYQEYYPNGCLRTEYLDQLDGLGFGTSVFVLPFPYYSFAWSAIAEPPSYYPDSIAVPTFMIGGWYDHNTEKMIDFFNGIRTQSPANVQNQHRLLMGPWVHGGHGAATVGSSTQGQLSYPNAAGWSDSLALVFFDYHLRNISNGWNTTNYIQYYRMGQNAWQNSSVWPPVGFSPVTLYFQSNSTLDILQPVSSTGSFTYAYDPNNPSPTVGGPTLRTDQFQGPYDQSDSVEVRNDVLKFTTAPLQQDMILTGNAVVHLEFASDRYDTDFCVRLCDVYPTGESMLVNDAVYRARFLNGFAPADTAALVPGQHYSVDIELPNTAIAFLAGHRIRVDVSSSNYPRFNRNMNTNGPMYPGLSTDTLVNPVVATNAIYTNSIYSSYITLPATAWPNGIANETQPEILWNAFPNPAKEQVIISNPLGGDFQIKLTDLTGRFVLQQKCTGENGILDLQGLAKGIYLIQFEKEGEISTRKILIE